MHITRFVSRLNTWLRICLYVLAALGLIATFLPWLESNAWWVRFLSFPRVQILLGLGLVVVALAALPGRLRPLSIAAMLAALVGAAGQLAILYPYSSFATVQIIQQAGACSPENRLRVVAANVLMTNENAEILLGIVEDQAPDIILLQETDEWWDERLATLKADYPYTAQHVTQNFFGIHLLSKYPLVDPEVRFLTSSRNPSIFTGIRLPSGQDVAFYGIHPRPPTWNQSTAERDGQILAAALAIAGDDRPSILAGDLNAVPWSPVVRRALRIGGLLEPRIGRGWTPTYSAESFLIAWPLDHILASDAFTLSEFGTLPAVNSDHHPIVAELCFAPDASQWQSAPELEPDDIEKARRAVVVGQEKAGPSAEPAPGKQDPDTPTTRTF